MSTLVGPAEVPVFECLFAEDPMDLFRKICYRLQATIAGSDYYLLPGTIFLDTGASPTLVSDTWLPEAWTSADITTDVPRLRAAGK